MQVIHGTNRHLTDGEIKLKRAKVLAPLVSVGFLATSLAACGSSSKPSAATATTTAAATSTSTSSGAGSSTTTASGPAGSLVLGSTCTGGPATGSPVIIRSIAELNSPDGGVAGDNAAAKAINGCGGINGHPIHFEVCYDNGAVSDATKCAHDAVADSSTLAIGGEASSYGSVVDPIFAKANMAILGLAGPGADLTSSNYFAIGVSNLITLIDGDFAIKYLHLTKVGLPYLNLGGFGTEATAAFKSLVTGPNNVPAATAVPIDVPETNFPGKAAALSGDNVVVPALDVARIIPLVQAMNAAGEHQPIVLNPSVFTQADYKTISTLTPTPVVYDVSQFKLSGTGYNDYEADMKALGEADTSSDNATSIDAWISIHEIADVANKIGPSVTRQSLLTGLSQLSNYDTLGLSPPLNFTQRDPKKVFGNIIDSKVVYYKVTSNGYVPLDNSNFESGFVPASLLP